MRQARWQPFDVCDRGISLLWVGVGLSVCGVLYSRNYRYLSYYSGLSETIKEKENMSSTPLVLENRG